MVPKWLRFGFNIQKGILRIFGPMKSNVRVRFAPSPTGMLHIGGLRTALFNYLFAKHHGGTFILRIEDTDQNRYVDDAENDIIKSLEWAGLKVDEGPQQGGPCAPYRQSERSLLYRKHAEELVEAGHAYVAFDTTDEIEAMRERLIKSGNPSPKYDSITRQSMKNSLTLPQEEVKRRLDAGEEHVIRLKVPRRETIKFDDLIRGTVSFDSAMLDDQVLMKSDGLPTYHLANVVDDHTMDISHVIRGEEWLSSAPKHILLYQYFGWTPPTMAHLPLIMSPAGGKLSKRNAEELGIPVNVRDYVKGFYEPEALVNFLAFLGWNPGDDREMMTMDQLISEFSLERVSKAGAVFNMKKLLWYNEQYFRARTPQQLLSSLKDWIVRHKDDLDDAFITAFLSHSDEENAGVIGIMSDRVSGIHDIAENIQYFYVAPSAFKPEDVSKAWKPGSSELVASYVERVSVMDPFNALPLHDALHALATEKGVGLGKLMQPLRLALTGKTFGPDLFEFQERIGREESLKRLEKAMKEL